MANLKEIRTRLSSVKTTSQITSAMKMVSAAKLRKAQDAIIRMRPYAQKLSELLQHLAMNIESEHIDRFHEERELNKILLIVITSNKGLCGAFNANIVKLVINDIGKEYEQELKSDKIDILCIGKKGAEILTSRKLNVTDTKNELVDSADLKVNTELAQELIDKFIAEEYDLVKLYYNQFKNAATQIATIEQLLPMQKGTGDDYDEGHSDYILEPGKKEIVEELIPKSIKNNFNKAILDSIASEHGARMTAMHKATDNAMELIKQLQLDYNKARQASITNEILEIVGGAEALK